MDTFNLKSTHTTMNPNTTTQKTNKNQGTSTQIQATQINQLQINPNNAVLSAILQENATLRQQNRHLQIEQTRQKNLIEQLKHLIK